VRRGFTLVEVLVALTVGAMVVLVAHRSFATASELAGRVREQRRNHDHAANARRFLAAALGSVEVGGRDGGFQGGPDRVAFTAWVVAPTGEPERRRVTLTIAGTVRGGSAYRQPEQAGSEVIALVQRVARGASFAPDTLVLIPHADYLALDYLMGFGANAAWVSEWQSAVTAPLAVRLRIGSADRNVDTLLFGIWPRG
jgi:prepilin-type N-terminal cleavage/methylation domain-containing protein